MDNFVRIQPDPDLHLKQSFNLTVHIEYEGSVCLPGGHEEDAEEGSHLKDWTGCKYSLQ